LIKLNEEGIEELWEEYNTMEILDVVDALDKVRYVIGEEGGFKPPEIRDQLLKIHALAFKQLRAYPKNRRYAILGSTHTG